MQSFSRKAVICALLASAMPVTAWAQDGDQGSRPGASEDAPIVVTARRREELLSKVPVAVTALSADAIAEQSIHNENDLQAAVPGLVIKQSGSANAFIYVIRGQTIDTYTNSPPGVLPYINEAQVVTWSASTFYDMGGIQVLKGPQGTLFGRNTTGGAVLFQTHKAEHDFGGYVSGRYGRWNNYQIQGALNLPINDAIAVRIAASKTGEGAYIKRLDTGKRYGNLEQESIRGTLLIDPGNGFKNTTVIQHTKDGGTNAPAVMYHSQYYKCDNPAGFFASGAPNSLGYTQSADCSYMGYPYGIPGIGSDGALPYMTGPISNGVVGLAEAQDKLGPYTVIGQNSSLRHSAKSTFVINTTEIELGEDLLIKNILMWNRSWSDEKNDYDGGPYGLIGVTGNLVPDLTTQTDEGPFYNRARQISEELQLQGKAFDGKLDYTLGVYYINQKNRFDSAVKFFDFYPLHVYGPTAPTYIPIRYTQDTNNESYAVFAQLTYALTDRLNFTLGGRYTWDKTTAEQLPTSDFWNCGTTIGCFGSAPMSTWAEGPSYLESQKESKPSWNISLDFQATPELLLYVTQRGSWRAGSFNYSVPPLPLDTSEGGNQFKPETTYDVEAGIKYSGDSLVGFPVSFNIDFYNQWVKNIQRGANLISPFSGTSILVTASVPKAEITGVEADLRLKPSEHFSFGGSLAYTDARFTKNTVPVLNNPALQYGPYADAPKWSGTIFAEVSNDFGPDTGILKVRGDMFFQSKSYFANLGYLIPGSDIDSYQLFGARVSWEEVMGTGLTLSLYGRNLTNTKYYTGGNPTGLSAGFMTAFPGFPRTYGIEARFDF